jgi:AcrR family transcriptional regulator
VAGTGRQPTIEEVAEAAGVSVRSVYRLFPDTDSLVQAAIEEQTAALAPLMRLDVSTSAPLAKRVAELVARRSRAYDRGSAFRSVLLGQRSVQTAVARVLDESRAALRAEVVELFGRELSKRSGAARNDLIDAIEMATGWSAWDALRNEQGLSPARARRVTEATVVSLLTSKRF